MQNTLMLTAQKYNNDMGVLYAVRLVRMAWNECMQLTGLRCIRIALPANVF